MLKRQLTTFILLIVVIFSTQNRYAQAQAYKERFDKNRIQYKDFDWKFYQSENYEVYYYSGGEELAKLTSEYLEDQFSRITETIGYFPYARTRVFLYNSIIDKQQSNVGIRGNDFSVGGQTNFVKSQVEIAYSGDLASFKQKAVFGVSDMLIQEMLYGGNIAEMFQSAFSTPIPRWFTTGVSSYIAYGWDKQMDDAVREYVYHNQVDKFARLSPEMNEVVGRSIWNYVVQKYGQRSISNILNLARIIRNEETSIARTLGVPFDRFMLEWRTFYSNMHVNLLEAYQQPNPEFIISGKNKKAENYTSLSFSPNGKYLAYAAANNGKFEVRVVDMDSQKESVLYNGGLRIINQEVDSHYPLISWADTTTLGIVFSENGKNKLAVKRIGVKGEQKINIPVVTQIQSFDFKPGGRQAVLTGAYNGISDAYTYNIVRGQVRRISDDTYDERDISYFPGSNQVIFSSNRPTDSVFVQGPESIEDVEVNKFNLFTYNLDYPDSVFGKITNSLALDLNAEVSQDRDVIYLSDQQGINNIYKFSLRDSLTTQISNYAFGVKQFTYDAINNRLAYVSTNDSKDAIFFKSFTASESLFTPVTPRKAQETSKLLAEIRRKRLLENRSEQDTLPEQKKLAEPKRLSLLDSVRENAINTENYQFENASKVDTKDYQFETADVDERKSTGRSFLNIYQNTKLQNATTGPYDYESRMHVNSIVTSFAIDEIRSFSQLIEVDMNDFLEDHRFSGGMLIPWSFNDGYDVFAEYEYLKHRVDVSAHYFRKAIVRSSQSNPDFDQKYFKDRFEIGFGYPFTQRFRVELNPFFTQTRYLDNNPALLVPSNNPSQFVADVKRRYVGFNAGLIYDNSVVTGTNIHEGTRAKLTFETHAKLNETAVGFSNLKLDIRHYQRVTKGILLAGRFYYGSYFGDAPKRFLLGGVDNWAFNSTDGTGDERDPLFFTTLYDNSDILFTEFVNLRGYDYNTFRGRNVLTANAEIRFPINQLLNNSELKSNFLRNLQIITFYDIGSAWDDLSPFEEQNNLNIEEVNTEGSPFSAVLNNFNNPWLQSTGVGMRTMFLGFFSRVDLSFPIRNFEVQSPQVQLSFGYDF